MRRQLAMAALGFTCLTLAACQTAVSGAALSNSGVISTTAASASGAVVSSSPAISSPVSSMTPETAAPASSGAATAAGSAVAVPAGSTTSSRSTATATPAGAGSGGGNTGGSSGNSGDSNGSGGNAPAIVSLKITCTFDADQMQYVATAHYRVANATGVAVSVDDPGAVGSFGSAKGTEGDIDLPGNGCYADAGEQVYDFDTTGGSPSAHKEIKRTGTHQRGDKPAPPAPKITEATLSCSKQSDGSQNLTLEWAVANATGMALSVDNPGGVGSFGTYDGTSGSVDLPSNACYSDAGSHEFDLQTVGGADPPATEVLNFNGGHSRPGSGDTTTTTTTTSSSSDTTTTPPAPGG